MRDAFRAGTGSLFRALPVLLIALSACGPDSANDGYAKVTHREQRPLPAPTNPNPPPVIAGIGGAGAAKLVAKNLPAGVTQAMVDEGQQAFGTVCAACHGPGGTGTPAAPALNDDKWLNITGQYPEIVTIVTNGVPKPKEHPGMMPPRGGGNFNEAQVRALAAYVFALSHQGGA